MWIRRLSEPQALNSAPVYRGNTVWETDYEYDKKVTVSLLFIWYRASRIPKNCRSSSLVAQRFQVLSYRQQKRSNLRNSLGPVCDNLHVQWSWVNERHQLQVLCLVITLKSKSINASRKNFDLRPPTLATLTYSGPLTTPYSGPSEGSDTARDL